MADSAYLPWYLTGDAAWTAPFFMSGGCVEQDSEMNANRMMAMTFMA